MNAYTDENKKVKLKRNKDKKEFKQRAQKCSKRIMENQCFTYVIFPNMCHSSYHKSMQNLKYKVAFISVIFQIHLSENKNKIKTVKIVKIKISLFDHLTALASCHSFGKFNKYVENDQLGGCL